MWTRRGEGAEDAGAARGSGGSADRLSGASGGGGTTKRPRRRALTLPCSGTSASTASRSFCAFGVSGSARARTGRSLGVSAASSDSTAAAVASASSSVSSSSSSSPSFSSIASSPSSLGSYGSVGSTSYGSASPTTSISSRARLPLAAPIACGLSGLLHSDRRGASESRMPGRHGGGRRGGVRARPTERVAQKASRASRSSPSTCSGPRRASTNRSASRATSPPPQRAIGRDAASAAAQMTADKPSPRSEQTSDGCQRDINSTLDAISAARSDASHEAGSARWTWYWMPSSGGACLMHASPMTTTPLRPRRAIARRESATLVFER
mmetsp:Transcript_69879/g.191730  ORF Transcript_69879/g.191730 Transcript_69879/m.191730 type:complete len:325 (-) Transcript_69879:315-1289(-)